jgi:hypothetical protein
MALRTNPLLFLFVLALSVPGIEGVRPHSNGIV